MSVLAGLAMGAQAIGALTSAGLGIANYASQQEAYQTSKDYQKKTWKREDNAVQRRVADLKKAGINPMLAAGQSAQAGSPIHLNAPQFDPNIGDSVTKAGNLMGLMSQKKNLAIQDQEIKNLWYDELIKKTQYQAARDAQEERIYFRDVGKAGLWELEAERIKAEKKAEIENYSLDLSQKRDNLKILHDLGYTGKIIGMLKDILGGVR